ncbi:MAG: helix-turn-helix transcriptional regulator [Clostridia bacterium]|nr:helix-turn-helix transcriptional regulator [Clostridia bacterium]
MNAEKKFAERFKDLMDEKGVNDRELERATGLSNQVIAFWRSGKRVPSLHSLWILADYFDCSIEYLVGRVDFE